MHINDFDFTLPEHLIAQYPPKVRGESRLLCALPDGDLSDLSFADFPQFLNSGDVLVINNTEVIKARLFGQKSTGGQIEVLVERVLDEKRVLAHVRASKSPKENSELIFSKGIRARCLGREGQLFILSFLTDKSVYDVLQAIGHMPLPPYIERAADGEDDARYQTVFAQQPGAVAAPTAGLHFTKTLLEILRKKGVQIVEVTLHVGAGTFQPVRVENIADHQMHSEYFSVSQAAVDVINHAKIQGNKICAAGTTSVRALESAALSGSLKAGVGETDIFITPGYQFRVVDMLLTNFHLPKSTLLMLVSAFAGQPEIWQIYQHAIVGQYRFFSYGDAMLLYCASTTSSGSLKARQNLGESSQ